MAFHSDSVIKNLPAVQEAQFHFLGCEDPLEKEMATHTSILAWESPWTEEPAGLQSMALQKNTNKQTNRTEQLNNNILKAHILMLHSHYQKSKGN